MRLSHICHKNNQHNLLQSDVFCILCIMGIIQHYKLCHITFVNMIKKGQNNPYTPNDTVQESKMEPLIQNLLPAQFNLFCFKNPVHIKRFQKDIHIDSNLSILVRVFCKPRQTYWTGSTVEPGEVFLCILPTMIIWSGLLPTLII